MCHSLPTALYATWSLQFQPMERRILLSGLLFQEEYSSRTMCCCCCWAAFQSWPTLCDPMRRQHTGSPRHPWGFSRQEHRQQMSYLALRKMMVVLSSLRIFKGNKTNETTPSFLYTTSFVIIKCSPPLYP